MEIHESSLAITGRRTNGNKNTKDDHQMNLFSDYYILLHIWIVGVFWANGDNNSERKKKPVF